MFSVLPVFIVLLDRFEHPVKHQAVSQLTAWRVVIGTILLVLGLTLLATAGTSTEDSIGLQLVAGLPAFIGAVLLTRISHQATQKMYKAQASRGKARIINNTCVI